MSCFSKILILAEQSTTKSTAHVVENNLSGKVKYVPIDLIIRSGIEFSNVTMSL
jgi:hypothetical protein